MKFSWTFAFLSILLISMIFLVVYTDARDSDSDGLDDRIDTDDDNDGILDIDDLDDDNDAIPDAGELDYLSISIKT